MSFVETHHGLWVPLAFLLFTCLAMLLSYVFSFLGRKDFAYSKEKAKPFISGHDPSAYEIIKASDYFWGFFKSTENYYSLTKGIHTGLVNDYIFWFIVVASILLIVFSIGVFIWV
ncbi:MAG: hypothetical protein N3F05_02035 [Candidatus Diapherotrites archaeon]|nr:hypothetical protein [Candidatus Diapherotrites archaeon]